MNRALYCTLFLFIAVYSYADIGIDESVCRQINYQSTDCKVIKNKPDIEKMQEELEYLRTQHYLELAKQGIFEAPQQPIIIYQRPDEGVIVKTYFEEIE